MKSGVLKHKDGITNQDVVNSFLTHVFEMGLK